MRLAATLVAASFTLGGLVAWEGELEREARGALRATARIERLLASERKDAFTVAAVSIVLPERGELLYVRSRGRWRCATALGAPASGQAIGALLTSFLDARGVRRAEGEAKSATFGLDESQRLTVRLHGPKITKAEDRDVLVAYDVGPSLEGGAHGRSFVREVGKAAILEIDHDPRRFCEWPADRVLPPLLDERVIAGAWPSGVQGFARVFVDFADGASVELARRMGADGSVDWVVRDDSGERAPLPYRVVGFLTFLARAPISGLADPAQRAELGHDPPAARVTIFPMDGEPLELHLGRPDTRGSAFVWNAASGALVQTSATDGRLLAPDAKMLCDPEIANPWESWLSR